MLSGLLGAFPEPRLNPARLNALPGVCPADQDGVEDSRSGLRLVWRFCSVLSFASGFTSSWLLFGVVAGLILAIINGLRAGLGTTLEERLALGQDARRVIHDDLVVGLVFGLLVLGVCLVLGALLGLALERAHGLHYPLAMGLLVGLVVGMVFGVTFGLSSAVVSGRHATASLLFGFTGIFPRRPAQFLEWARNAGLLRVTGIAYQFRHDTYQQWLTEGAGNRDVTVGSGPPADARSRSPSTKLVATQLHQTVAGFEIACDCCSPPGIGGAGSARILRRWKY